MVKRKQCMTLSRVHSVSNIAEWPPSMDELACHMYRIKGFMAVPSLVPTLVIHPYPGIIHARLE